MSPAFYFKDDRLFCENVDLTDFCQQKEMPFYIYSKKEIVNNCRKITKIGSKFDFMPCYAFKAYYNPAVLKLIRNENFGADVVSAGELHYALRAGFTSSKIVFAGVGKTKEELAFAIDQGIHSINVESAEELQLLAKLASKMKKEVNIAVRVNPDVEAGTHEYISTGKHINKFGVPEHEAIELYKMASKESYLVPLGVHVHIGSQIVNTPPFEATIHFLKRFVQTLKKIGVNIEYLDLGGGIGINYQNKFDTPESPTTFLEEILPVYLSGFRKMKIKLVVELGRSVVGSAGLFITKVLYRKFSEQKNFAIVDGAMNNLIRPSLYNAYHEILPLQKTEKKTVKYDIVGPVCESGDFLGKDREMQELNQGDLLAVAGAGAYGQVLSSNYNLRPRVREYLVDGSNVDTIFAGESEEDLLNLYKW